MLRRGDSIGVFQLEGAAMRSTLRSLAPTSFDDVAALVALYRPGPMAANMHRDYAGSEERPQAGHVPPPGHRGDPRRHLRPDALSGVGDAGGAAFLRLLPRGGRQPPQGVRQEEPGAHRRRAGEVHRRLRRPRATARRSATQLFDIIEPFADYAFNKSHSYGYGLVAYQTAWLKANYPVEYLAALLVVGERRQGP